MTTITYRDGRIAGDSQVSSGSVFDCTITKVAQNERGDLAGASGCIVFSQAFLAWFSGGEKGETPKCPEDGEAFIVRGSEAGRIECWDSRGYCCVFAPYYAIGSGKRVALGAMAFGASAAQAVECAAKHDIYTSGEVTVRSLPGALRQDALEERVNPPRVG